MLYPGRRIIFRPLGGWGFLAASLFIRGFFIEPRRVEPSFHTIPSGKLRRRLRIVHLTDLHLEDDKRRDYVPKMVSDYKPALILMTGDYINKMNAISRLRDFSHQLASKYGIYACFGNWDAGKEEVLFENTRVTPLRNASVEIIAGEDRVCLVGIDLPCGHDAKSALKHLDKDTFNILLHHSPDLIEDIAPYGTIDLYLAGHTHGGQVRIPFLRALKKGFKGRFPYAGSIAVVSKFGTKYESGRFQVGDTLMYVNRGVGMEGGLAPRMRLFCPPELAVLDIVPVRV